MSTKRVICLLSLVLVVGCTRSGDGQGDSGTLRKLVQMPELYWERVRECKRRESGSDDTECRVSLEEVQERRRAETERGR